MSAPTWATPPPIGGPQDPRAKYVEALRLLMTEPGRWAVIKSGTPSAIHQLAGNLRTRAWNIPPGCWEFTVRTFRRGQHIGDMNVAQLYARFIGPQSDQTWTPEGWRGVTYRVREGTVFDEWGYRICPDCGDRLTLSSRGGSWPTRCDACWEQIAEHGEGNQRKWARMRQRRREHGYPQRTKTPMCIELGCREDGTVRWRDYWLCLAHAQQVIDEGVES